MSAPARDRVRALRKGHWAEWVAALYLVCKGYRILARRYVAHGGEIDLVALRGDVVAFVEVKARDGIEDGLLAIGAEKRRRIGRAVRHWTARNAWCADRTLRGDAVIIRPGRLPAHVVDAFPLPM